MKIEMEKGKQYRVEAIKDTLSYRKGFKCWIELVDYDWNDDIHKPPKLKDRIWVGVNPNDAFIFFIGVDEVDSYFKFI